MGLREDVFKRSGGKCECAMTSCGHKGRCGALLRGEWEIHHITAGGPDALSNVKGMCQVCHRNTPSYGTGKR
jgi:5-methylcytosine-specific restriction endonuclease McrA